MLRASARQTAERERNERWRGAEAEQEVGELLFVIIAVPQPRLDCQIGLDVVLHVAEHCEVVLDLMPGRFKSRKQGVKRRNRQKESGERKTVFAGLDEVGNAADLAFSEEAQHPAQLLVFRRNKIEFLRVEPEVALALERVVRGLERRIGRRKGPAAIGVEIVHREDVLNARQRPKRDAA